MLNEHIDRLIVEWKMTRDVQYENWKGRYPLMFHGDDHDANARALYSMMHERLGNDANQLAGFISERMEFRWPGLFVNRLIGEAFRHGGGFFAKFSSFVLEQCPVCSGKIRRHENSDGKYVSMLIGEYFVSLLGHAGEEKRSHHLAVCENDHNLRDWVMNMHIPARRWPRNLLEEVDEYRISQKNVIQQAVPTVLPTV